MSNATSRPDVPTSTPPPLTHARASVETVVRTPGLDALRCGAMFLVLMLHAAIPYGNHRIPHLLWGVWNERGHWALDLFFWGGVALTMPVFFFLSGLFTARAVATKGIGPVVRERIQRILVPTVVATLTILPLTLLVWNLGWFVSGRCSARQALYFVYLDPEINANRWGPAHLWFLYYLIQLTALFLAAARWIPTTFNRLLDRLAALVDRGTTRWLVLTIPTTLLLWLGYQRAGIDPIMGMHNILTLDLIRFAHHGWFFLIGLAMARRWSSLDPAPVWLTQSLWFHLVLAFVAFAARAWLLDRDLDAESSLSPPEQILMCIAAALTGWFGLFAALGLALCLIRTTSPILRWLTDSSYWVYLVHFPIVGLAQVNLHPLDWSPFLKFLIVAASSWIICLASYQLCVRYTLLGSWLHGVRLREPHAGVRRWPSVSAPSLFGSVDRPANPASEPISSCVAPNLPPPHAMRGEAVAAGPARSRQSIG